MLNKKGFSFIGTLIALTIIMILTVVILKKYQTLNATNQIQMQQTLQQFQPSAGQTGQQNTLRQLRNSLQDIEKTAAQRADLDPSVYHQ